MQSHEGHMIEDEQTTQPAGATPESGDGQQPWSSAQPETLATPEDAATTPVAGEGTPPPDASGLDTPRTTTTSATPDAAPSGRLAELEARVAELEGQVAHEREAATEYMSHWQRTQADFANYRRRSQQEQEQREAQIAGRVVATLLPALDSFERAFTTLPPTLRSFSWIDGIALVHLQIHNALATHGIQPVVAEPGQAFDPLRHESIGEVESAEHAEGHIAVVLQRGYESKGMLLRPALVQIARSPRPDATSVTDESEAGATPEASVDGGEASGA
jgi:molecular chaperone GrpE